MVSVDAQEQVDMLNSAKSRIGGAAVEQVAKCETEF